MTDRTVRVRVLAEMPGYSAAMRSGAADTVRLGESAVAAGRGVRALGVDAAAARGGLTGLATGARGGAAALSQSEAAAMAAGRGVRAARTEVEAARGAFGRIGAAAASGFGSVRAGAESALEGVKHLGLLLAGGAVLYGLHDIVHMGNEYTDSMNKFLEVTRASGAMMQSAGREAQALGADIKLPTASAAEAADAMVELAKAGLSAQDAIKAARGTIQLSAAARTDVATAAKIEGDIMDQFALKATDATKVADTLANTVNSSSGELMDLYYAMKYVGPVAHSMGLSLTDVATAVGLLGKSGIIGETAGTALRSALVNMSKPTKQVSEGLKTLGIQAYDSQGNFKGLEYVISQLGLAQEHLNTQQFTAAAAMAFGKPALAAMIALAHQGGTAYEQFGLQVGRAGGAAALAAAESKGLGGAMRTLGKEISSTFLQVYLGISPVLEKITRGMATSVAAAIPYVKQGIRVATDLWDIYGPAVEKKLDDAAAGVKRAAVGLVTPLAGGLMTLATGAIPLAASGIAGLGTVLHNAQQAAGPLVSGMQDLFTSVSSGAGALGTLTGRLSIGVGLFGQASGILRPLGEAVGVLAHGFAALPGPIQLSVLSMLAMRPFRPQIQQMQQSVVGFGRAGINAFRGIGDASLYQRVLAAGAGQELGRFGGYVAALEARSPGIAAMGNAFRGVYSQVSPTATAMQRFSGTLRGLSTAAGVGALRGLRSAASGLLSVFGGGWGLAVGGAMMALDYFSRKQQEAKQSVIDMTAAMREDSSVMGENTRALVAQKLSQQGLFEQAAKLKISQADLTNAVLGQADAVKRVNDAIQQNGVSTSKAFGDAKIKTYSREALNLTNALKDQGSVVGQAARAYKDQQAAIAGTSKATDDATNPTGRLQSLIKTLADSESDADTKARALHQALQLLSGGELDVQAAVANMNQTVIDLNNAWKDGVDKSKGFGRALLQADGSLNTVSENGQTLWTKLQALNEQTASAAQATFDYARANNVDLVQALHQAEGPMQTAWQNAVKAGEQFGLSADQAKNLAAQMGFIPSSLAITLSTPGMSQTQKDMLYVAGLQGHLSAGATVKVAALTADATKQLENVGFKIKTLPGGRQVEITVPTGAPFKALDTILAKLGAVQSKTIDVHVNLTKSGNVLLPGGGKLGFADGGVVPHAANGAVFPGYAPRQDTLLAMVSPGEGVLVPEAVRKLGGRKAIEQLNRWGRYGSMAAYASGGVIGSASGGGAGFTYAPAQPGSTLGVGTGMDRYNTAVQTLQDAVKVLASAQTTLATKSRAFWSAEVNQINVRAAGARKIGAAEDELNKVRSRRHHTAAQVAEAEKRLSEARKSASESNAGAAQKVQDAAIALSKAEDAVKSATKNRNKADANLGLKAGAGAPTGFNLAAYEKQLAAAAAANAAWEKNLSAIGKRAGGEVEDTLRQMGSDGASLVAALAKASGKQFADIVKQLKSLAPTASATLADYTKQFQQANAQTSAFQQNLLKLAAMGDTALAQQLAAQGDDAAAAVAAAAVKDKAGAAKANAAAKAGAALSGNDVNNALSLLGVLQSKRGAGLADVLATGMDLATIRALVPKIRSQLSHLPAGNTAVFLKQLAGQGGATAMASGGLLTSPSLVLGGEAGVPESWIPWNDSARSKQLLSTTAARFGYQLVPARAYASAAAGGSGGPQAVHHHRTVNLYGSKQSTAEQAADLLRHMTELV